MLLMFIISMGRFGFGDVKMATLMGLAAGFPAMTAGLFFTAISAGLVALVLMLTRIVRLGQYMPYGPFIALGAIVASFGATPSSTGTGGRIPNRVGRRLLRPNQDPYVGAPLAAPDMVLGSRGRRPLLDSKAESRNIPDANSEVSPCESCLKAKANT